MHAMRGLLTLPLLLAPLAASAAMLDYTFDADAQGWRKANLALATLALTDLGPATWNPAGSSGGFLTGTDVSEYTFHLSPELSGASYAEAYGGTLSLDFRTAFSSATPTPFVVLTNGAGAIFQSRAYTASETLQSYGYTLAPGNGWMYGTSATNTAPATESQIRGVLGGLTRIGVTSDVVFNGPDLTAVDNVRLAAPVPEPASLIALGLGALALRRRRA